MTLTNKFYNNGAIHQGSIRVVKDSTSNRIYFIGCTDNESVLVYDYITSVWKTHVDCNFGLSGKLIRQIELYENSETRTQNTYIVFMTSDNKIHFVGASDSSTTNVVFTRSLYTFNRTYGLIAFLKCNLTESEIGFYVLVKNNDRTSTAFYIAQNTIAGNKTIDVMNEVSDKSVLAFLGSISNNIVVSGNTYDYPNNNIVFGSYNESGKMLPLIKDFSFDYNNYPEIEKNRMFRTINSPASNISLAKGISYGKTQMTRVRLYPETILNVASVGVGDDTKVSLKESSSDATVYTTGEYIWKMLKDTGMPYNTHVEAVGRIVVNGNDIPIEKAMITMKSSSEDFGDVLFTFDKMYDIMHLKDNLSEGIATYPGVLFFKNNGFLQNAIISNSHALNGSLFYDDSADEQSRLFKKGIVSIVCSCRLDDGSLLVGTNTGAIASVNIQTGGYTSVTGVNSGDNPPGYYRGDDDYSTYGCIVGIIQYRKKIFAIYGMPTWENGIKVKVTKRPIGNGKTSLTLTLV